jgi:hypothetical protein
MNMSNPEQVVTAKERLAFLKRQGWREDMTTSQKQEIESAWTDADIRMAIDMNLA